MDNELQRAINLIRKTGDRIIVFDSKNKQNGYVLLSLEEYERLALARNDVRGLTEEELLDKINRDIAIWRSEQESEPGAGVNSREISQEKRPQASSNQSFKQKDNKNIVGNFSQNSKDSAGRNGSQGYDYDLPTNLSYQSQDNPGNSQVAKKWPKESGPAKWQIPPEIKQGAEEIIEEEKQYLEYIPF